MKPIPIWLGIGALLTVYGVVLTAAGIAQLSDPPPTVLSELHATLWGGFVLLGMGGTYLIKFWPRPPGK